jgi:DUF4097 and DUF4098 domain-containing protein YvlB
MGKVYVDENNRANVICPRCGFEKNVDAMNFRDTKSMVKGKCKCSEGFDFTLEYRKHHRKNVIFPGEYIAQKSGEKGEVIIRELSLTGIRFELMRPHQISTDDILELAFKLDNSSRKEIRKIVKVIWVDDRIVGAQYTERELYNKDLVFYLNF